jgi:undecaprenyl-diphosphatase
MGSNGPAARGHALDVTAAVISTVADHGAIVAALVIADAAIHRRSARGVIVRLGVVGLPIVAINTGLKRTISRARPVDDITGPAADMVRQPSSSSFPSGHTLATTAAAVALPERGAGQVVALLGAGLVGWSRLRLRAHHATDVLGGLAIGAALGLVLRRALDVLGRE